METYSDRIIRRMNELNLAQKHVASATGAARSTVSGWLSGVAQPSGKRLLFLANLLQVSADWILTGKEASNRSIVTVFDDGEDQRMIPVLSMVQAGNWTAVLNDGLNEATEYLPWIKAIGDNGFAVVVSGYSMSPYFLPNDRLYVNPDLEAGNEDLVIAMCNDDSEATFKQLIIEGGQKYLVPLNKDWLGAKVINLDETCSIKGVVVSSVRPIDKRMFRSAHS